MSVPGLGIIVVWAINCYQVDTQTAMRESFLPVHLILLSSPVNSAARMIEGAFVQARVALLMTIGLIGCQMQTDILIPAWVAAKGPSKPTCFHMEGESSFRRRRRNSRSPELSCLQILPVSELHPCERPPEKHLLWAWEARNSTQQLRRAAFEMQ